MTDNWKPLPKFPLYEYLLEKSVLTIRNSKNKHILKVKSGNGYRDNEYQLCNKDPKYDDIKKRWRVNATVNRLKELICFPNSTIQLYIGHAKRIEYTLSFIHNNQTTIDKFFELNPALKDQY